MKIPYSAHYLNVHVRALRKGDIESLRIWRSDPDNTFFLKSIGEVTPQMQRDWFANSLTEEGSCVFAIEDTAEIGRFVGSLSIYDRQFDTAEIGKMLIDKQARGRKIGYTAMNLALHIGFQKLGINTFFLEVHEDNLPAKTNYERNGFVIRGDHAYPKGGREWDMILTKERFYQLHRETAHFEIEDVPLEESV